MIPFCYYIVINTAGVGTKMDPTLCRADRMVGHVLGAVEILPDIYTELEISYFLLRRLLGVKTEGDKKGAKVRRNTRVEFLLPPPPGKLKYFHFLFGK